jgi:hypothetical protein
MDKKCAVEGCENKKHGKGFCNKHYVKWLAYGDPTHEQIKINRKDTSLELYAMANEIFDKNIHKI